MGRTAKDRRDLPHPKPVQKIELSEDHVKRRVIAAALLLLLGLCGIGYALFQALAPESGWQQIEAGTFLGTNCGSEFVLLYELGVDGSAQAEHKGLTALYTQACRTAFQLFHTEERYDDVVSVCEINARPNEAIRVDSVLYRAFEAVRNAGDRTIYLGPVYARYGDLFYCVDDVQLVDVDPYLSDEVRQEYAQIAAYAMDPQSIDVELLGEGQICLRVSEEYLAYAQREGITRFIDFSWLRNAFIADYLAETLIDGGYTYGSITSYDGYARCLDSRPLSYSLNLYDRVDGGRYLAGTMEYQGPMNMVSLRDYPLSEMDAQRFYQLRTGEIRTMYLDPRDGLCKSAVSGLSCYSQSQSCAELALKIAPIYIADQLQPDRLAALTGRDVYAVYCQDRVIYGTDPELTITNLYEGDGVEYTLSLP